MWIVYIPIYDLKRSCLVATGQLKMFSFALFIVPNIAPRFTCHQNPFHAITSGYGKKEKDQTGWSAHQGSAQVAVAFSVRQQQRSIALEINMKPLSASGRLILWNILGLPSPSGRSMLYSGMHSRNSSSISTAFFSVNLTQWNMLNQLFYSHWKKINLANSCRGLLPLVLAASADTLRIFDNEKYHEQISTVTSDLLSVRSTLAVFMWPSFTWKMPLVEQKGI